MVSNALEIKKQKIPVKSTDAKVSTDAMNNKVSNPNTPLCPL